MAYRLIIRPDAELDIREAFEWYEAQILGLGSEFVRAVDVCLSSIGRNPLAYPIIYKQARRAFIWRFPYRLGAGDRQQILFREELEGVF